MFLKIKNLSPLPYTPVLIHVSNVAKKVFVQPKISQSFNKILFRFLLDLNWQLPMRNFASALTRPAFPIVPDSSASRKHWFNHPTIDDLILDSLCDVDIDAIDSLSILI